MIKGLARTGLVNAMLNETAGMLTLTPLVVSGGRLLPNDDFILSCAVRLQQETGFSGSVWVEGLLETGSVVRRRFIHMQPFGSALSPAGCGSTGMHPV
ncbi:MAG: hypothetical protein KGQ58_06280 [Proteobacteria bacterium]|nr:hypothetical protein [Pseudomonadota bacterium]